MLLRNGSVFSTSSSPWLLIQAGLQLLNHKRGTYCSYWTGNWALDFGASLRCSLPHSGRCCDWCCVRKLPSLLPEPANNAIHYHSFHCCFWRKETLHLKTQNPSKIAKKKKVQVINWSTVQIYPGSWACLGESEKKTRSELSTENIFMLNLPWQVNTVVLELPWKGCFPHFSGSTREKQSSKMR